MKKISCPKTGFEPGLLNPESSAVSVVPHPTKRVPYTFYMKRDWSNLFFRET